jgi:hypothetical protein
MLHAKCEHCGMKTIYLADVAIGAAGGLGAFYLGLSRGWAGLLAVALWLLAAATMHVFGSREEQKPE